ncbi:MAG: hypothetical protein M5T61_21280 [Acidimicrobiia bacterium]|nr:hypothetical protein [Acidimicrobiia bacterium]
MHASVARDPRTPILYLAPWVDYGGSDKGTIDWFRWIDRSQFAPSLITTQPSPNRRLSEVVPFADEVWGLPDLLEGSSFRSFILDFIESRRIRLVHLMNSRLGFCLLPELASLQPRPAVVVQLHVEEPNRSGYVRYVTTRFGNLVDAFSVTSQHLARAVRATASPRTGSRSSRPESTPSVSSIRRGCSRAGSRRGRGTSSSPAG